MPIDTQGYKAFTLTDIQDQPSLNQPAFVERLIYEKGKTIVVGKPKCGKSWLAIGLTIAIAQGRDFMGFKVRKCPVLYLEFDRRHLSNTVHEITKERSDNWVVVKLEISALNQKNDATRISNIIRDIKPKLVVIDHKSVAMSGKENEDEPTRKFLQNLDTMSKEHQLAFLLLSQENKGGKIDIVDKVIGSSLLSAWADTVISITRIGQNFRKLESASNYGDVSSLVYTKDFQVIQEQVEYTKKDIIVDILKEKWEECKKQPSKTVEEVSNKTGFSYKTIWDAYREVKQEKAISEQANKTTSSIEKAL